MRLLLFFLMISFISFSQEKEETNKAQPLFISTINLDSSYYSQDNLDAVSNNIKTVATINSNKNNDSNFVTLTKNVNKYYKLSDFKSEININKELDNVMYSGNFFNPKETHFSALCPPNY